MKQVCKLEDIELALKGHLKDLIDKGVHDIEITEFNCQLQDVLHRVPVISIKQVIQAVLFTLVNRKTYDDLRGATGMQRWKSDAINDLRMLDARRMAIKSLKARCDEIEADMASISAITCDRMPIRGGGNRQEAMLAGTIDQLNKVSKKREAMICLVGQTERVLAALSDRDRMILEVMYVHRKPNPVRFLENRLYLSPSGVYSAKEAALLRFAVMMGYR